MTEKQPTAGFPYIVLPTLSSDIEPPKKNQSQSQSSTSSSNKAAEAASKLSTYISALKAGNEKNPPAQPKKIQTTPIGRHLALSRQFATTNSDEVKKDSTTTAKEMFSPAHQKALIAQQEKRKSPRSFYAGVDSSADKITPSASDIKKTPEPATESRNVSELVSMSANLLDLSAKTRLTMQALSQIFPHSVARIQNSTAAGIEKSRLNANSNNELIKPADKSNSKLSQSDQSFCDKLERKHPNQTIKVSALPERSEPSTTIAGASGISDVSPKTLKSRIDGLSVHVKNKDNEVSQLKQHVIELQMMLINEKKGAKCSQEIIQSLTKELVGLKKELGTLEKTVEKQENTIINRLILMDGLENLDTESDSENSDSEYALVESQGGCSCSKSPIERPRKPIPFQQPPGINALKECLNWVPVAPDFDKMLNAIALLNYRMDRNQSMKLSRNGNEASFKHADTIKLGIYKNGITLGNTGFRTFATLQVIKFVNEIFSGYFPSELHTQFPDGVIFIVSDKRSIPHHLSPGFNGSGVKLGDSKSVPGFLPGTARMKGLGKRDGENDSKVPEKATSLTEMSIYDKEKVLGHVAALSISLPDIPNQINYSKNAQQISLKLKNINDGKTYRFKLPTSSTIDDVLLHLEKHLINQEEDLLSQGDIVAVRQQQEVKEKLGLDVEDKDGKNPSKFDIILPYPNGILSSGSSSLKEYGFVTNTCLYFKPSYSEFDLFSPPVVGIETESSSTQT